MMFLDMVPLWFFIAWSLLCVAMVVGFEKKNVRNCVALLMVICLLVHVVISLSGTTKTTEMKQVDGTTESNNSDTEASSEEEKENAPTDEELEEILTHKMDIPIDEKITLGKHDVSLMSMFGEFLTAATKNGYQITSQETLDPGVLNPEQTMEFMMINEEGDTVYAYTYVQNTSDIKITVDYGMMLEVVVNPQALDTFKFLNFTKDSTHDDYVKEWGDPEATNSNTGEHVWSTKWGHIYVTFNSDNKVSAIDFYIHDDYLDKTKVKWDEDTAKTITKHVEEEVTAYETRKKADTNASAE